MIKEDGDSLGGIGGMAIDGMGGMGFTSTDNIAGIALGMTPVDDKKKKKKKKKKGEKNMDENVLDLIAQDLKALNEENLTPKGKVIEPKSMAKKVGEPTASVSSLTPILDRIKAGLDKISTDVGPRVKQVKGPIPTNESIVTEDSTSIMPVPAPFYTPNFNLASGVGTDAPRMPQTTKGPRKRMVLSAILGGL